MVDDQTLPQPPPNDTQQPYQAPTQPIQVPPMQTPNVEPVHAQDYRQATPTTYQAETYQPALPQEPAPQQATSQEPVYQQPESSQPTQTFSPGNTAPPPNIPYQESELFPGQFKPIPEELLVEWQAPSRPFKQRSRQFFSTMLIIVLLVSLILFFTGLFVPIAVVLSVAFLVYVLYTVPPELITNRITTYGIRSETDMYYWEEMSRFWLDEKFGQPMVHIEVIRFPGRLTLLLNDLNADDLTELLSEVLINEKPVPTYMDKAAQWLSEKIPLDSM